MKLLVFDVGGIEIKHAIVEDALTISEKGSTPTPTDRFESFLDIIKEISDRYKDDTEGIALSMPGPVDVKNGIVEHCGAMKYRHDREIGKFLSERCGRKVVMENDGKAAAIAEHRHGALKGCVNAAVFLIGTGIGGGLIINRQVVRGVRNSAGEFSFINTEASSYTDFSKILGNSCSTSFLLESYRRKTDSADRIGGREFFMRLPDDPAAQASLDELCTNIAVQINNLYRLLDLEKIAIGGGISRQPALIDGIREKAAIVAENSMTGKLGMPFLLDIVPCRFGNDANLIGAYETYREMHDLIAY